MHSLPDTLWVILAGGQARRMGGQDKGLVSLNDKPLIDYVYHRLHEQGATVAVNANRNQDTYGKYGQVFGDVIENFPGPLGGIHAAMAQLNAEWYGFVPCDCPNLPHNLLEKCTPQSMPGQKSWSPTTVNLFSRLSLCINAMCLSAWRISSITAIAKSCCYTTSAIPCLSISVKSTMHS